MSDIDDIETITFESWADVDHVRITTNLNKTVLEIMNSGQIRKFLAFIDNYQTGWYVPEMGVPIARRRLNLYENGQIRGNLGINPRFFTVHVQGSFWFKPIEDSDFIVLLEILQLEPWN